LKARALLLILIVLPNLLAQAPAPATVSGILLRWGTEEPVGQATVELRSTSGNFSNAIVATRDNGEFLFPNIVAGSYRVIAFADGYAPAEYGQLRQNGSGHSFTIAAGERVNLRMGIVPGAVLAGRVTNQNGQPMVYSIVEILKATYDATGQIIPGLPLSVTTNDLGEYRAFWLPPGPYIVRAGPSQLNSFVNQGTINPVGTDLSRASTLITQSNRPRARTAPAEISSSESGITPVLSTYYGGAPDPKSAQVVELRAGAEVAGIDIRVAPIQFTRRIRLDGVVVGPNGQPNTNNYSLSVATWPDGRTTALASARALTARVPSTNPGIAPGAMVYVMDNGKFEGAASSGFYQIRASQGMYSGRTVVEASNQDLNVTIHLHAPSTVTGRVLLEGEANANVDLTKLQVGIRTPPSSFFPSPVAANGQFRFDDVIDGDYEFRITHREPSAVTSAMENVYVKSIRFNGTDALNSPLRIDGTQTISGIEIVVGLRGGSVDGRVVNQRQESLDRATIVLLPQGPPPYREDRYRTVTTDKSGQFQFRGLPPGDYRILAWEDIDAGAWFNPAFLASNEQYATALTLVEGRAQKLDVTAIPVAP
jgi:protocatechuate 3,4-dioxygenase beta subunit